MIGAAVLLAAGGQAAGGAAPPNLIANGTFDGSGSGSLAGWKANRATLSLVAGDGDAFAARVTAAMSGRVDAYSSKRPVTSVIAGQTYVLTGVVRSDNPGQTVCLVVNEVAATGSTKVGSGQQCVTTATAWQSFPTVTYTGRTAGDRLTVMVRENSAAAGATYDIDTLSLTAADTTPPSVPQNVGAAAGGPNSVTVTWSPSSDNPGGSGLAGYDVYRNGSATPLATVGPTVTSYTDGTVAAATNYSYTVDAFDASGNYSAQSSPPATVTTPSGAGPCGLLPAPAHPVYSHVVVVMDENLSYDNWLGAATMPYTNQLAGECALATNAVGATHPSQPNYVAATSGTLIPWNGNAQSTSSDNLFHQLDQAGMSWQALEEGMQSPCSPTTAFPYKTGHNPAFWFTDLGPPGSGGDGSCALDDVPFSTAGFDPSTLAAFTWITPNQCDDMHWLAGCPESQANADSTGDTWLSNVLGQIFATPAYRNGQTLVLVMWDEGAEGGGVYGIDCTTVTNIDSTGCHVPLIAASAYITPGTLDSTAYSDYSVLAAIENMWGLPLLNRATTATPLGSGMGF